MVRPCKHRFISANPLATVFKPQGIPARHLTMIELGRDELEALRLADAEGLYHEQAAEAMGVSRPTFGRVLAQARAKVAHALLEGKGLILSQAPPPPAPLEQPNHIGESIMRIAVASDGDGKIAKHGGHCTAFLIFDVEGDQATLVDTRPNPHGTGTATNPAVGDTGQCHGHQHGTGEHHHHGHQHGHGHGHHHGEGQAHFGLPALLKDCRSLISRSMGRGLFHNLQQHGMQPCIANETDPQAAALAYAHGHLVSAEPHACCQGRRP